MKWDYDYCLTGATGFVGSHVVDEIVETELRARVLCLVRKSSNTAYLESKGVDLAVVDFSDPSTLAPHIPRCRFLLHLAGVTQAPRFEIFDRVNRDMAEMMLSLYLEHRERIEAYLYMSSLAVVGPCARPGDNPSRRDRCKPISRYGRSKLEGEALHWPYLDDPSTHIIIVRPPAVYGPRDEDVKMTFEWAKKGLAPLIGWKEKRITLVYARDLARFAVRALNSPPQKDPVYHIHGGEILTQKSLYKEAAAVFGKKHVLALHIPCPLAYAVAFMNEKFGKNKILNREKVREINADWGYERNDFGRMGMEPYYSLKKGVAATYGINNPCSS
jgi:nucleoside-diphosphate-sugar epimerase